MRNAVKTKAKKMPRPWRAMLRMDRNARTSVSIKPDEFLIRVVGIGPLCGDGLGEDSNGKSDSRMTSLSRGMLIVERKAIVSFEVDSAVDETTCIPWIHGTMGGLEDWFFLASIA